MFDVICAGEALLHVAEPEGPFVTRTAALRLRPGGGAVSTALALAQQGLYVGLATALNDDTVSRKLVERIAAAGVDVGGVSLGPSRTGIVFVEGTGPTQNLVAYRDDGAPSVVPSGWSSRVLLISGLSPVVAQGAALCKAARAARRTGSVVVMDLNARRSRWADHDPRVIRSVIREADVIRCSTADLAVLATNAVALRALLAPSAVLVLRDGTGAAWASGPFGEVARAARPTDARRSLGSGDVFTAAICAELSRVGSAVGDRPDLWDRALQRAQAAVQARALNA
ncbi:Fructokinase [Minicystis rosea]|nr:Fructokinase [Minicystis rosea]